MNGRRLRRLRGALTLDTLYRIPDAMRGFDEWQRRDHLDLAAFPPRWLLLDRERLRQRLLFDRNPDPWLLERWERLAEALARAR